MHKSLLSRIDFSTLIPALLIVLFSLASFYSIDKNLARQQFIFLLISVFAYFIFLNIDYKILGYSSRYLYFIILVSLVILLFVGIDVRGAVRWIDIFGMRLQISEIAKPLFIIFIAKLITEDDAENFLRFSKSLLFLAPIVFLILMQPDLGNGIIYAMTTLSMLIAYGMPLRYFLGLGLLFLVSSPLIFGFLADYQKYRLINFINPGIDPQGTSYNAIQSLISIGSGETLGKGFGEATQSILKFLPERHTDFIFATLAESIGFLGICLFISLFVILLYRIYKTSLVVSDDFSRLLILGFYFLLIFHVFLNIGMNIGIVPVVGITLPFASYGGSFLLTGFIMLGIIASIKYENRQNQSLEIK